MGLREKINENPAIARTIAVLFLVVAVGILVIRSRSGGAPDSIERRSQTVTIRDTLTGDEWTMNRGEFERLLLLQNGPIDPNAGVPSEFSDGKPVGILVDKSDWTETVERINAMKARYSD